MTLQPTAGSVWRNPREEGVVVLLPSGNAARLRPVGFDLIVRLGRLPEGLVSVAIDAINGGEGKFEAPKTRKDVETYVDFYNAICECSFIQPRIVTEPKGEDEIALEDLSWADKKYVSQFLNLPAAHLAVFRQEQTGDVGAVHPDAGNQTAPLGHPGDTPVGSPDTRIPAA